MSEERTDWEEETGELIVITIDEEQAGQRLDKIVSCAMNGATRSAVQKWMEQGYVTTAGKTAYPKARNCAWVKKSTFASRH